MINSNAHPILIKQADKRCFRLLLFLLCPYWVLKLAESFYDIAKRRNINDEHFDRFNFEQYGGVPMLGVSKPIIIGHGISHAMAFKNMIRIAHRMLETDLLGKMKDSFLGQA